MPPVKKSAIKGQWTEKEDERFIQLHPQHDGNFRKIAGILNRDERSVRSRWVNHLMPGLNHDDWSEDEKKRLHELHDQYPNQYAKISRHLPGRTSEKIKNYFKTLERQLERQRERIQSIPNPNPMSISNILNE